ncbi:MAG: TetR/AcrR family transcriptional regulator [Tissierellales bacterium]
MVIKEMTTEEKILSTAIELYPIKGDITIREIAKRAGVNVAAINYHFTNKDNLMKAVEKHYSNMLYDMQNRIINDPDTSLEDKLIIWCNNLMEYMFRWPSFITLVTNLIMQNKDYESEIVNKFFANIEFMTNMQNIISQITGIEDKDLLNYKYIQLFSGVLGPILFQVIPLVSGNKSMCIDFSLKEERKRYINNLVKTILIVK